MSVLINEEKVKNRLEKIMKSIQTEADPQLLNLYRSCVRKKVPFFQRSYVAAYLLMLQDQGPGRPRRQDTYAAERKNTRGVSEKASQAAAGTEGPEPGRHPLPEEESVRLFISMGRNRRVFPREILGLIGTKTSVSKDDIGTIRILDNYSFVQVRNSVAEELISALNGVLFRGRTLTVNYARVQRETLPEDSSADPSAENREHVEFGEEEAE
jgi:hypothetical protein